MIVLDASAAIELVLNTVAGKRINDRIADEPEAIHVPHLIDVELIHVIRRFVMRDVIGVARGETAIRLWRLLDVQRHDHEPFMPRIWQLRNNLSAYDATYVALADALSATLITADRRLSAAPGTGIRVEVY